MDSRFRGNDIMKFRTISCFLRFDAPINRGVAQLVAHLLWEQGVARSNRVAPTNGKDEV